MSGQTLRERNFQIMNGTEPRNSKIMPSPPNPSIKPRSFFRMLLSRPLFRRAMVLMCELALLGCASLRWTPHQALVRKAERSIDRV